MLLLKPWAAALYVKHVHEEFGPLPQPATTPKDAKNALLYHPGRRYALYQSWSGWGHNHDERLIACQGDNEAANDALAAFAALPLAQKELRLFPGTGQIRCRDGKTALPCDWHIHWVTDTSFPRGERKSTETSEFAVMTLFVARADPIPAPDPRTAT
jgi:hypothetical protein